MSRKPKEKSQKPRPVSVGALRAYARRGPKEGRWYWQVVKHEGEKQTSIPDASLWAPESEILRHLATLLAAGRDTVTPRRAELRTMDDLLLEWLEAQKKRRDLGRLSPKSYATYYRHGEHLRKRIGAWLLTQVSTARVQDWIDETQGKGASGRTIHNQLTTLRTAWNWARRRDLLTRAFPNELEMPEQAAVYSHRTPTATEIEQVLDALLQERWKVVGELLWSTGGRIGEVISLTPARVDLDAPTVILDGKTGPRTVPIPEDLAERLRPWVKKADGPLWGAEDKAQWSFYEALRYACKRTKIEHFSPHAIRRRCSTRLIAAMVDPKTYAALMGHSYEIGLKIYAEVEGERVEAARALLGRAGGDVILYKRPVHPPSEGAPTTPKLKLVRP